MRAVLDTNVIVSAALSRGSPPDQILQSLRRGSFEAITSPELVAELERVILRRHIIQRLGWTPEDVSDFVGELRELATVVVPLVRMEVVVRDPTDNRVLEAAVEGDAQYVVTGDRHLLDLREYEGIAIVTPARFVAVLRESGGLGLP